MNMVMVGVIKDSKNRVIGYRIADTDVPNTRDIDKYDMNYYMNITNTSTLKIRNGDIMSGQGEINNYSTIINNIIVGKSPIVILKKITYRRVTVGYKVCDGYGAVYDVTKDYLVNYAKQNGMINAKLIDKQGKEYIVTSADTPEEEWAAEPKIKVELKDSDILLVKLEDPVHGELLRINSPYGYISGYVNKRGSNYFMVSYIDVNFEYQKQGVGTALYKSFERIIKERQLSDEIRVGVDTAAHILFWNEQGFQVLEYMNDTPEKPESSIMYKKI